MMLASNGANDKKMTTLLINPMVVTAAVVIAKTYLFNFS